MEYINVLMHDGSILLMAMAMLVFGTNIIVQVVKNLFPKVPTNFVAVGVALSLTILAMCIMCAEEGIPIMWHYVAGAVILGLFVGYAAMFGFDKFKAAWDKLKALRQQ